MGFFSWDCKACGHPALSHGATDAGINDWMEDVVVLSKDGSRNFGEYDGYGCAGSYDYNENGNGEPCLYHRACWEVAGKPKYTSPSKGSNDQGWFFADGDHDLLDPARRTPLERWSGSRWCVRATSVAWRSSEPMRTRTRAPTWRSTRP